MIAAKREPENPLSSERIYFNNLLTHCAIDFNEALTFPGLS
jgi:hypothetical protein